MMLSLLQEAEVLLKNIVEMLAAENLPKPTFEVSGGHFRIIFQRPEIKREIPGGLSGTLNGTLSGTLNHILVCIKENPGIQANQISNRIKKPIDTVKKQIKQLADKGLVIRKGSRKTGGYWAK
ncbi:winged helix-turn-helix transcriptional regulator [Candidatus Woesearchaeota archaeon]|nr:winged helix-turn-helix transcriptional regulator [Candidatus Woesearchaeota archaeon]